MSHTVNPQSIVDLAEFWVSHRGVNLGIKGDTAHQAKGVSYHLGKDDLVPGAGSARLERDRKGLTNAASALDLGALDGSLPSLRVFSRWLVARCRTHPEVRHDIREIIYTPDGRKVQRYSGLDNRIHTGPGNGDLSHLTHTHISFFRDSEFRPKVQLFKPFFQVAWAPDVPAAVRDVEPGPIRVATAIRRAGHDFGTMIDMADLVVAMARSHQDFGTTVGPDDVKVFVRRARQP